MNDVFKSPAQWASYAASFKELKRKAHALATERLITAVTEQAGGALTLTNQQKKSITELAEDACFLIGCEFAADQGKKVEARYSGRQAGDYVTHHILVGSSPPPSEKHRLDFPGKFSLQAFLERVIAGTEATLSPEALLACDTVPVKEEIEKILLQPSPPNPRRKPRVLSGATHA